jgi:carbamoyl-phosphate synthase large subunit
VLFQNRITAARLNSLDVLNGVVVYSLREGEPHIADQSVRRNLDLILNAPLGRESFFDDRAVRRAAMMYEIPCITTLTGAAAAVSAIRALREHGVGVRALQDYHAGIAAL